MKISENIRALAREGVSTTEIARRLGIRYQHAYNVLKSNAGIASVAATLESSRENSNLPPKKVPLTVETLLSGGFALAARWQMSDTGNLVLDQRLPKSVGVYAFVKNDRALYVGVATMGIAKRLYFYGKPGATQRTSQRINGIIKNELLTISSIDIYIATPPDQEWMGMPIHGSAGLELGLIKKFSLPWNMRSAGGE